MNPRASMMLTMAALPSGCAATGARDAAERDAPLSNEGKPRSAVAGRIVAPSPDPLLVIVLPRTYKSSPTDYAADDEIVRFSYSACAGICRGAAARVSGA